MAVPAELLGTKNQTKNRRRIVNWKKILLTGFAALLAGLLAYFAIQAGKRHAENDLPMQGQVRQKEINMAPKVPGRLKSVRVREGEWVKKGDTLAIIDVPEIEAKRDQARAAVLSARARHEKARNGATEYDRRRVDAAFRAALAQYEFADSSYNRMQQMFNDSLIAAQEYDQTRSQYLAAKANLEAARAKKQDVDSGVRPESIEMARGAYEQARAALREAETAWEDRVLTAPADLHLRTVMLSEGELATPGYNLFAGYDHTDTRIRFSVPESKLADFETGEQYTLRAAMDNRTVQAWLERIAVLPDYASMTSMYPRHEPGESLYELYFRPDPEYRDQNLQHNMQFYLEQ